MLSLEEFKNAIDFIQQQRERQDKFIEALEFLSPGEYCNCFIYFPYEGEYVKMIKKAMNISDSNEDLEYWLYENEFGKSNMKSIESIYSDLIGENYEVKD